MVNGKHSSERLTGCSVVYAMGEIETMAELIRETQDDVRGCDLFEVWDALRCDGMDCLTFCKALDCLVGEGTFRIHVMSNMLVLC